MGTHLLARGNERTMIASTGLDYINDAVNLVPDVQTLKKKTSTG